MLKVNRQLFVPMQIFLFQVGQQTRPNREIIFALTGTETKALALICKSLRSTVLCPMNYMSTGLFGDIKSNPYLDPLNAAME